jgi:hypothetical protein
MNCEKVKNELKAYLDNELNFITKWIVARHIKYCRDCKLEMNAMESISNEIKETQIPEAPKDLKDKVLSKIKFEANQLKPVKTKRTLIYSLSTIAAFIIIAVIIYPTFFKAREKSRLAMTRDFTLRQREVPAGAPGMPPATSPAIVKNKLAAKDEINIYSMSPRNSGSGKSGESSLPGIEPMIIKTADMSIQVKDFDEAFNRIIFICKSNRGYIVSTNTSITGERNTNGTISFRVPNSRFEMTVQKLSELGKVTSNNISGDDVSGEVVDLESNLRNKRAEEKQYLIIMERAKRISDVITVTNELTRVRGEIDQIQGRLKYLKSAVSLSTINVELFEKIKQSKPNENNGLGKVFMNAIGSLVDSLKSLASVLIWILVFSPFWAIPIIVWLIIRHRNRKAE